MKRFESLLLRITLIRPFKFAFVQLRLNETALEIIFSLRKTTLPNLVSMNLDRLTVNVISRMACCFFTKAVAGIALVPSLGYRSLPSEIPYSVNVLDLKSFDEHP